MACKIFILPNSALIPDGSIARSLIRYMKRYHCITYKASDAEDGKNAMKKAKRKHIMYVKLKLRVEIVSKSKEKLLKKRLSGYFKVFKTFLYNVLQFSV